MQEEAYKQAGAGNIGEPAQGRHTGMAAGTGLSRSGMGN